MRFCWSLLLVAVVGCGKSNNLGYEPSSLQHAIHLERQYGGNKLSQYADGTEAGTAYIKASMELQAALPEIEAVIARAMQREPSDEDVKAFRAAQSRFSQLVRRRDATEEDVQRLLDKAFQAMKAQRQKEGYDLGVTKRAYDRIQEGMTPYDVDEITGVTREEVSRSGAFAVYLWKDGFKVISCTTTGGKVDSKSQAGL